ncbi:MAG: hypothetical protein ABI361_00470 [Nitrososphaera sp.]
MQTLSAMALPVINVLGTSGYPALHTFLSQMLDRSHRFSLFRSRKSLFLMLAAVAAEVLEELV